MAQIGLKEKRMLEISTMVDLFNKEIDIYYKSVEGLEEEMEYINKPGFYIPIKGFPPTKNKMAKAKKKTVPKKSNAGNDKNKPVVKTSKSGTKKK